MARVDRSTPKAKPESSNKLQEPAVLQPVKHDGISEYYLQEHEGTHAFSSDAYLTSAMGLQGMNPKNPTEVAPTTSLGTPDSSEQNGPFGGPMLDVRVGERLKFTIDGSHSSAPFNLHWHGVHGYGWYALQWRRGRFSDPQQFGRNCNCGSWQL